MLFTFAATWAIVAGALTCGIVIALLASAVVYKCVTSRRRRTPLSQAIHRNSAPPSATASIILTTPKKYRSGSAPVVVPSQTNIRNTSPAPILPNETFDMRVPRRPLSRASTLEKPIDVSEIQSEVYTVDETKRGGEIHVEHELQHDIELHKDFKLGTLHFRVGYNDQTRVLTVVIEKLCNLPPRTRQDSTDPYVKLHLLPDRTQKVKTRVFRKNLHPEFDETFTFYGVTRQQLTDMSLHFIVLSYDRFSRDDVIGEIVLPIYSIEKLSFGGNPLPLQRYVAPRLLKVGRCT